MANGQIPDLIGWAAIAAVLKVHPRQAMKYEAMGLPVFNWGPTTIAAYMDRVIAWSIRPRKVST